jgi:hypothetical protein
MLKLTDYIGLGNAEYSDELIGLRLSTRLHIGGKTGPSWRDVIISGVSPLVLTNALGLNYIKALGATEQRNLPSGYTQVEYLQSSGTQYIDTGVVLKSKATITTVGQFMSISSSNPISIWGFMGNSNMPRWGCSVYTNMWLMDLNFTASQGNANTNKHTFVNETNGTTTYDSLVDGVALYEQKGLPSPQTYTSNVLSAYIFARNNSNEAGNFSSSRIFSFNIIQDDIEVINLIPARRNSDNVLGMYDTITGNFLTNQGSGTFTAGNDVVPSPDNPVDIICNNGVLKVSKNLFDKDTINTVLGSIDGNGIFTSATNRARSEYIPVVASQTYTLSIDNSNIQVVPYYYNSTKAFLSYDSGWKTQPFTFTVPNNCSYLCILYKDVSTEALQLSSIKDVQLEKGSTATPYVPYSATGYYTDGTQETVEITGDNLYNDATRVNGYYISASGVITAGIGSSCSALIPVKPNATYVLSGVNGATASSNKRIHAYDSNGVWLEQLNSTNNIETNMPYTVTAVTTTQTAYVRISFATADTNVQVEHNSTATAENLFAIGNYKDEQEILAGNVTRNVGIKVLDGTEDWTYNNSAFLMNLIDRLPQKNFMFCTHFNYDGGSSTTIPNLCIGCGSTTNTIFIKYQTYNTLEQFKQYLADQYTNGTPVIVVYPLATPTTETVTGQTLTASGNCTVTATGSLDNLSLEVSYKQGVVVRIQEASNENLDNNVNVTIS